MENKEPSRNDNPKQEAAGEKYKQEMEQLLGLQEQHILTFDPTFLFGLSNAYLLFVTAFVAFGVLAYYSGHLTILKVVFVVSGLLLLVLPVSAAWYLLASFKKKHKNKATLYDRITKSSFGGALLRLSRFLSSPIWIGSQIALLVIAIPSAIRAFPDSPRLMLALIVIETIALVYFMITLSLRWLENQIKSLWEHNERVQGVNYALIDSIKIAFEGHKENAEAIKNTLDIIGNMNRALLQTTASADEPKHLDDPTAEEDKGS